MTDFAQAHARLLRDASIQFRFPDVAPSDPVRAPRGWSVGGLGEPLFWALAAVILIALTVVVVHGVRTGGFRARRGRGVAQKKEVSEGGKQSGMALLDAEALARDGAYGAAVHALLLRCIAMIGARFPRLLLPGHTGRDIAAMGALPAQVRSALAGVVAPVERAVFARQAVGLEEWVACQALSAELLRPGPP